MGLHGRGQLQVILTAEILDDGVLRYDADITPDSIRLSQRGKDARHCLQCTLAGMFFCCSGIP